MFNKTSEEVLSKAFSEYATEKISSYPSDSKLKEMYPIPKKHLTIYRRKAQEHKHGKRIGLIYLKRIVVACLVIILLTISAVAVAPQVKEYFTKKYKTNVSNVDDNVISFNFDSRENDTDQDVNSYVIGYLPEEYKAVEEINIYRQSRQHICILDDSRYLIIDINFADTVELSITTENVSYTVQVINDNIMHISYNDEEQCGTIHWTDGDILILISGYVSYDELIKIAENIK